MLLTLATARNPKWANTEHTAINLLVTFEETVEQLGELEFSAMSDDIEPHGRDIFARAVAGEFGPVAEFVLTRERALLLVQMRTNEANAKISALQGEVDVLQDAVDLDMATAEEATRLAAAKAELTAWKRYRILLSRVEAQPEFPTTIDWPVKPE